MEDKGAVLAVTSDSPAPYRILAAFWDDVHPVL